MNDEILRRTLRHLLSGKDAHVRASDIFDGLDWQQAGARPPGVTHSAYDLLRHMVYWNDWVIEWLDGRNPPVCAHASDSWPAGDAPATPADWDGSVDRFRQGLHELERRSGAADLFVTSSSRTGIEMLAAIASHTSYHAGQVAMLRQILGSWPPPSGGLTW